MSDVLTPIDRYLAEQRDQTAVERFARRHDDGTLDAATLEAGLYADRLPVAAPGAGQQYAFRVDLDRCTGCKACVAGCHSLNGLDEGESWRTVGQLVAIDPGASRQQTVPSGCHHCVDPACLSGCPTNAYEKDPFSGIVRHLDDQCFGCGYCELTCPYEVPKLNKRLGVVRKCDLCADRLAEGEAPACVQACPTSAITIDVVDTDALVAEAQASSLVPGAPDSAVTVPSTQYVSSTPLDGLVAADHHALHPDEGHPPLVWMLVLTQASIGAFVAAVATGTSTALAAAIGAAGVAGAFLHLGRPMVAWRAVLGVGHSWFSREVVALGGFVALAGAHAVATTADVGAGAAQGALAIAASVVGAAGIVCSGMIYVATKRTWWAPRFTLAKFGLTAAALGPPLVAPLVVAAGATLLSIAVLALTTKLALEATVLRRGYSQESDLGRTQRLLTGVLGSATRWRFGLAGAGIVSLLGAIAGGALVLVVLGVLLVAAGEFVERHQFFVASVAPRMPGGFRR